LCLRPGEPRSDGVEPVTVHFSGTCAICHQYATELLFHMVVDSTSSDRTAIGPQPPEKGKFSGKDVRKRPADKLLHHSELPPPLRDDPAVLCTSPRSVPQAI